MRIASLLLCFLLIVPFARPAVAQMATDVQTPRLEVAVAKPIYRATIQSGDGPV
jgi:hypothetical protein